MSTRRPSKTLSLLLSLCLATTLPATSLAQGTSYGPPGAGSITTRFYNPDTGEEVWLENLAPGQQVRIEVHAYDGAGNRVSCDPAFGVNQGITGDQIRLQGDRLSFGRNFGSAEFTVECKKLPGVKYKHAMYNRPPLGQKPQGVAETSTPAPSGSGAGAAVAAGIGVAALAAAGIGVALAAAAAAGGSSSGGGGGGSSGVACSDRVCSVSALSGQCSCVGSSNTTCPNIFPVRGAGGQCTLNQDRTAWCSPGLSCTQGSCGTRC